MKNNIKIRLTNKEALKVIEVYNDKMYIINTLLKFDDISKTQAGYLITKVSI